MKWRFTWIIERPHRICKIFNKTLVYVVMIVVAIVCATTAYSFGSQIFSNEGVDPKPGTDMTFTVDEELQ